MTSIEETLYKSRLLKKEKFDNRSVNVHVCKVKEHPIHFHEVLEIIYVLQGSIVVKASCEKFTLVKDEYMLVNAYDLHSISNNSDDTIIAYIHFNEATGGDLPLLIFDMNALKRDEARYFALQKNLKYMIEAYKTSNEDVEEKGKELLKLLFTDLNYSNFDVTGRKNQYQNNEMHIGRLNEIINYLYVNYSRPLALAEVAEAFNLSKYYMAHIIKAAYGISFKELLNLVRSDRAELLLLEDDTPVGEICYKAGFTSQQHFSKSFKYYFGYTPLQYRKKFKQHTIQHKLFEEEVYSQDIDALEKTMVKKQETVSGENLIINIETDNENIDSISVIKSFEGQICGETTDFHAKGSKSAKCENVKFDCEELIIIVKKKARSAQ